MGYIDWFSVEEIYAGTTLRDNNRKQQGSFALHTGENEEAIIENRKALMEELNHSLNKCVFANQVHGDRIYKVSKEDIGAGAYSTKDAIENCDALYTREKELLIGVFTADCVPILLYDKAQKLIVAIHSGWKGSAKQITAKTLNLLHLEEDCEMEDMFAYIGPAIDFLSYEVGEDVIQELKNSGLSLDKYIIPKGDGKYLLDNKGLNMQMLLDAGIPDTHIFVHDGDTFENEEDFFSYRKNKDTGRNMTFILQK